MVNTQVSFDSPRIHSIVITARFSDGLPSFLDSETEIEEPVGTSTRGNSFSPRGTPLPSQNVATQTKKDIEATTERYVKLEQGVAKGKLNNL